MANGPSRHAEKSPAPAAAAAPGRAPETSSEPAALGGGQALAPSLRGRMEESFGQSFSGVRVHDDANAQALAKHHGARAFTRGSDIAFAQGQYRPDTPAGDRLVAHELAHVVQGGGADAAAVGGGAAKSDVSQAHEPAEQQADAAADRAVQGQPAGVSAWGASAWSLRQRVMRKAEVGFSAAPAPVPVSDADGASESAGPGADATKGPAPLAGANRPEAQQASAGAPGQKRKKKRPGETTPEAEAAHDARALTKSAVPLDVEGNPERAEDKQDLSAQTALSGQREPASAERNQKAKAAPSEAQQGAPLGIQDTLRGRLEKRLLRGGAQKGPATQIEPTPPSATKGGVAEGTGAPTEPGAPKGESAVPISQVLGTKGGAAEKGGAGTSGGSKGEGAVPLSEELGAKAGGEKTAGGEKGGLGAAPLGKQDKAGPAGDAQGKKGTEAKAAAGASAEAPAGRKGAPGAITDLLGGGGPVGGAPQAPQVQANGGAGAGGGGAGPSIAGGGGGGGGGGGAGGEAAAEDKDAAATEEKMDQKQPEEERAAEEAQSGEEEADGGGGGGGGDAEATDEGAGAGDSGGGGAALDGDSGAAGGGEDGAGSGSEPTAESAPNPTTRENEQREQEAKAKEESQAVDEEAKAEEPEPEAQEPSREDGELAPAEREAGMAAVAEDVVGGGDGGGGGGGGGGGAVAEKPAPAPPDVSALEPKAAVGSLKGLSPIAIKGALGGVSAAVSKSVSEKQAELAANPPTMDAPTGMTPKDGPPKERESGEGGDKKKSDKVAEGEAVPTPELEPTADAPPSPVEDVSAPAVNESSEGEMSEDEAAQMGSAVENIPANADEVSTDAGEPPTLALEGDADPAQMGEQREAVDQKVSAEHAKAAGETSIPMGEGEIAPQASNETVTAESSGGAGGGAGAAGGGEATPDEETASIVAQEEKQGELDAAADKGAEDMAAEEEQHTEETEAEKQRTKEEAERADEQAASDQQAEKSSAQRYVAKKRGQWRDEQTAAVETSQKDALKEETDTSGEIETERESADASAQEHIESGERDAKKEKGKKESEAEAEKAKAKNESSGFFGWLARKAKAFFNKIKAAIKSIMKALRDVVKGIIDRVKKAALAVIEAARKVAVAAIRMAGDAIIAIGDVALAAFPEAREKFRGYINEKVADAEDAVNQVADALKAGVEALFDALGEFLDKALQFLEKALLAAVDVYAKAVDTIIKAAEAVAKAFGVFFALIKDIASGPGAWISNLGAAAVDGIKNHLVKAMKDAISAWFKGKVEEVLGLPIDVMKTLFKGGISLDAIATMAWSALKSAIPPALIQLLIEKLVSMIVPAAGAVMAIIEGLQAAWGTVSKIIAAIDKFIAFLKAVKAGGAGPQFATAVAAGAVAVIDFVANWLLLRLMKPAKKVSGKIAAMAKKILAKIKKGLKKVGKKLKKAWKKAKGFVKKKFGKKGKKGRGKERKKDARKKKEDQKKKRIEKAQRELPPKVSALLAKKPNRIRLALQLRIWRAVYRMRSLEAKGGETLTISGVINPTINLGKGWTFKDAHLMRLIKEVAEEIVLVQDKADPATAVEPSEKLPPKDLTGDVDLPGDMNKPGRMKLGDGAELDHRATPGSVGMGGARAIVEPGKDGGPSYPQLQNALGDANPGAALESLFRDPKNPNFAGLNEKQRAATLAMFGLFMKEATHPKGTGKHGRDLLHGAMLTQLLNAQGPHAITGKQSIDLFPAGFGGAQAGARTVTNKLNKPDFKEFKVGKLGKNAKERRRREATLLEQWGKMHLPEWQKVHPTKPDDNTMKGLIRKALEPLLARFRRGGGT